MKIILKYKKTFGQHLKEKCLNCGRSIEKSWNYCPSCSKEL